VRIIRDSDDQQVDASVVTTGAFDGVHRGHQTVIREVQRRASERCIASAVVTFDVHPAVIVRPESAPKLLTRLPRKLELLEQLGVDVVYVIEFDADRATTTAEEFITDVFVNRLHAQEILVGSDFHFGKGREGTVEFLSHHGDLHGFSVEGLDLIRSSSEATEPISSTAIRRALIGGDIERAETMLGRPFELRGTVVQGDQRGRTIGFPTANVTLLDDMARPANGVYACWYVAPDGVRHPAAVNVGVRPTFYESADAAVLEAHLLDFDGDLYGQEARVQFHHFLRSERRFAGIDELRDQLGIDIVEARNLLMS
jgi:riboflavin kinase/FMN adenylyltransferase